MILITGANGQLGRLVIEKLLQDIPAKMIVAAVRHPEKAHDLMQRGVIVRQADYDQPHLWPSALKGVFKVLIISSPDIGGRAKQAKAVIDAVKNSDSIKLVAYTSMLRASTSQVPYASEDREIEQMISETGLPSVFLRHSWYTENYLMDVRSTLQYGALYGCAKDGKISGASRLDYAEAAAAVLTLKSVKPIYELSGDSSFTLKDVANELANQSGKNVDYVDLPEQEYQSLLMSYGLPEGIAATLAMADTGAANGDVYSESRDLAELIGRGTTPLSKVVSQALDAAQD